MVKNLVALGLGVCFSLFSYADEGMWEFTNLPHQKLKDKYGFEATPEWTSHLMHSSVRVSSGGSGSFISPNGLILTNHHVVSGEVANLSKGQVDYYKNGFYAVRQEDEMKVPGLSVDQLLSIEDVTAKVTGRDPSKSESQVTSEIEKSCNDEDQSIQCEVYPLHRGLDFHLYKFKSYSDLRLVFVPETCAAFFGGDADNFEFPRYCLDMSLIRAYENEKPAQTPDYLAWSKSGVEKNDLVFVSGNPGGTTRNLTASSLEFKRDFELPNTVKYLEAIESKLKGRLALGGDHAKEVRAELFSIQNALKVYRAQLRNLQSGNVVQARAAKELKLLEAAKSKQVLKEFETALEQIQEVQKEKAKVSHLAMVWFLSHKSFGSELFGFAKVLSQKELSSSDPLATLDLAQELSGLEWSLGVLRKHLEDHPTLIQDLFEGKSAHELAVELSSNTLLRLAPERTKYIAENYTFRKQFLSTSTDPMIKFVKKVNGLNAEYSRTIHNERSKETAAYLALQTLARVNELDLNTVYPDANFSPRLSYGTVKGYKESDGTKLGYCTLFSGAYEHENEKGCVEPYQLPETWHTQKGKLNLGVALNFVSTADIIGGNSGSPVVNRKGELVGLIFDGNKYGPEAEFSYSSKQRRSIAVASQGMLEALSSIYGADRVVTEILGN